MLISIFSGAVWRQFLKNEQGRSGSFQLLVFVVFKRQFFYFVKISNLQLLLKPLLTLGYKNRSMAILQAVSFLKHVTGN